MGANAGTAVPTYASGDVLTAANLNLTNSGAPVFADTSARDGAFGSGKKTLAEGQLCYLEDANVVQYYDGSNWLTVGPAAAPGLELVKTQTIGSAVSSVTVSDVFSATYDNYYISISGGAASTTLTLQMTLGNTATGYYYAINIVSWAGVASTAAASNAAFMYAGEGQTNTLSGEISIQNPYLAKTTQFTLQYSTARTDAYSARGGGFLNNTTSYTAFTLTPNTGTITGGEIRVYGYKN